MAEHRGDTGTGRSEGGQRFPRVDPREWGYCCSEVDDFLERAEAVLGAAESGSGASAGSRQVREHVFGRERGGYRTRGVDLHLDGIEDRFSQVERRAFIAHHGRDLWDQQVQELATTLLGRLNRPRGERFRRPSTRKQPGYSVADVDVLCDRVSEHFRSDQELDPGVVRHAVFRQARGHKSYEEQQVDAFLDRLVELILALR